MRSRLPWILALFALCGCRSQPARVDLLDAASVTTGIRAAGGEDPPGDAAPVTLRVIALERMPPSTLPSLAGEARFVMAKRGDDPMVSSLFLGRAACIARVEDTGEAVADLRRRAAGRSRLVEEITGTLPEGASTTLVISGRSDDPSIPWTGIRPEIRLLLRREADRIIPGLVLVGTGPRMEIITLEGRPRSDWSRFVILLRSPFGEDRGEALVAQVEIGPPRKMDAPPAPSPSPQVGDVRPGLRSPDSRRNLLIHLARDSGARITLDVALSVPEPVLAGICGPLADRLAPGDVGWLLESTTLRALLGMKSRGTVMWDADGILIRQMGEVGRRTALVEKILGRCQSLPDLEAALIQANLGFLENAPVAARLRAHHYLASRGVAPEGYDPLAPLEQRQAALARKEDR